MADQQILLPTEKTFIGKISNLKKVCNDNAWLFIEQYNVNNGHCNRSRYNWTLINCKNNKFIDSGSADKVEILHDRYLWLNGVNGIDNSNNYSPKGQCKLYDIVTSKLMLHHIPDDVPNSVCVRDMHITKLHDKFNIFVHESNYTLTIYNDSYEIISKFEQVCHEKLEEIINNKYVVIVPSQLPSGPTFKVINFITNKIVLNESGKFIGWTDDNKIMYTQGCILKVQDIADQSSNECNICYEEITEKYVMIPCGHTDVCKTHLNGLVECPKCRTKIDSTIKVYL
jgi:hypothetical protein